MYVARCIGEADTVEKERRRSPKSKLGEKKAVIKLFFARLPPSPSGSKPPPAASNPKIEPSASPQGTS